MGIKRVWLMVLSLLLSSSVLAQEAPSSNPVEVWVKGRKVDHSWRDGRIWVPTTDLQPLLNLSSDFPSMDLIEALEQRGDYLWTITDGVFKAERDPSKYTLSEGRPRAATRRTTTQSGAARTKGAPNQLSAIVQKFVAEETGYVRAWVQVTNNGQKVSDPSRMIVEFQDNYHYAWAKDEKAVPALQPGESMVYECFSMVPDEVKNVDGVQRTMNGDQVVCKFRSLTNPANDDQDKIRKENRRGRKIEPTPIKTSPLPNFRL